MKLVVYDEYEKFRSYKQPQFNYPYENRKNTMGSFDFDNEFDYNPDTKNYDYTFYETALNFRLSQVCMNNNFAD